jgi:hypothetical protein
MEATNLADLYGSPLLDWSRIEARLGEGLSQAPGTGGPDRHTCWLATINSDGSPHVTGIGALWADGCFWFETGKRTLKGRNLARDPTLHTWPPTMIIVTYPHERTVSRPECPGMRVRKRG